MTAPRVSDHALLRFLDRAGGLDVEQLRGRLESSLERAGDAAGTMGARDYLIVADGLSFVVRGGTVTTIIPAGSHGAQARALCRPDRGEAR